MLRLRCAELEQRLEEEQRRCAALESGLAAANQKLAARIGAEERLRDQNADLAKLVKVKREAGLAMSAILDKQAKKNGEQMAKVEEELRALEQRGREERERLKRELERLEEKQLCIVCEERPVCVAVQPCGHCFCNVCVNKVDVELKKKKAKCPGCPMKAVRLQRRETMALLDDDQVQVV